MSKEKKVLLKLRGEFKDIMYQINLEHKNNARYKNGQKVLLSHSDQQIANMLLPQQWAQYQGEPMWVLLSARNTW